MSLRATTRRVIALVEEASGCQVPVAQDASLKTLASVGMARGQASVHTITYNPFAGIDPDYFICFQCGFILRLSANPPAERMDLAGSPHGRNIVGSLLAGDDGPRRKLGIGFDLSKEYATAKSMHAEKPTAH